MNLIKAFDNTRYVKGEKGHKQYDWSENIQEKITEFYFQLVRNSDESLENKLDLNLSALPFLCLIPAQCE